MLAHAVIYPCSGRFCINLSCLYSFLYTELSLRVGSVRLGCRILVCSFHVMLFLNFLLFGGFGPVMFSFLFGRGWPCVPFPGKRV
mgnify:CR=1 FL=1